MRLLNHVLCPLTRPNRPHGSFLSVWVFFGLTQVLGPLLSVQEARADVTLVGSWTGTTTFDTSGFTYTPGAGSNRIALILITSEGDTNPVANVNQVTLGGQTLTAIENADGVVVGSAGAFHNIIWLGYLNEAGIGSMSGNALSITWDQAPNTPYGETMVQAATYQNVDQTTPIADSAYNTNTSASSIQAGSVSVGACDRLVYVTVAGNPADHTAPSGYTEQIEQDGPASAHSNASVQRDATTPSTENPTAAWSGTQRLAIISAVLNAADLALGDHTAGQESNAFSGSGAASNAELFGFKLDPGCLTISVTQLVFTLSDIAALSDGDWAGIEIVVDSNNDGNIGGGETTTVGGAGVVNTGAGTITFSTSFSVTAATNYILRADFSTLTQCDAVRISLTTGNITTTASKTGSTTPVTHAEAGAVQNLVGHWKLDDGAGGTTEDSAGTSNGTVSGAAWTDGKLCGALDFDGVDDYVDAGSDTSIDDVFAGGGTVSAWIYPQGWGENNYGRVTDKTPNTSATSGWAFETDGIRTAMRFETGFSGGRGVWATPNGSISLNTWQHVVAVFNSDSATNDPTVYINGASQTLAEVLTPSGTFNSDASYELWIGNFSGDTTRTFNGLIDDVRLYDRALTLADVQALAATYKVIDLGTLSQARSYGFSINDSEQIAGYDENAATGDTSAWRAQTCTFASLGTFTGGSVAESLGINSAGEVVGWSDNAAGNRKAFFYNGSLTDLGTLTSRTESEAAGVNASSEAVGTSYNLDSDDGHPIERLAFIYLPSGAYTLPAGINSLGTLGGDESVAMDINASGQVAGGAENAGGNMRPFRWANGVMTNLGTLGGENAIITHRGNAINSSGNVVGMSYTAGGAGHAFLYNGSMNDLGVLTGGNTSVAFDINDDGKIVGTSNVTGGAFHAFIYQDSAMTDLNDLIDTNSTWTLIRATGINDDGEIVGWGTNPDGAYHAFLLIQTCSGSGPPGGIAGFELVLAEGSGLTDDNGDFAETAVTPDGEPLAEIVVINADPGKPITYRVTAPAPDSTGAPGPGRGTLTGFADGLALERTMTVETPAPPGSFKLTVRMSFVDQELADRGIAPADVEVHVLDRTKGTPPGLWIPAGANIGESEPTDIVGDSGFVVYPSGTVDYWAVRDAPGVFAVGAKAAAQDAEPAQDADDDSDETPAAQSVPRVCGLGMVPCALVGLMTLIVTRTRRPRF